MSEGRSVLDVRAAAGGWPHPWPNVAELASVLPADQWTLIGGLMTQLHSVHAGIGVVRPTNDVDIALHIETVRGAPSATALALESIGYRFEPAFDPRENSGHRWVRGGSRVDVVTGEEAGDETGEDSIDVVTADHAAPSVRERMKGREMIAVEGGTQALRRTVNARLEISAGVTTLVSVPRAFGALILKAAAYRADSRDPQRHLFDAAALLACIEDPFEERESFAGSDRSRLATLERELLDEHPAWRRLDEEHRERGQAALRLLCLAE